MKSTSQKNYFHFNGKNSYIEIPTSPQLRNLTSRSHTVSVLVRAQQQEEKVPIWLVGDEDRRFCEYPILRRPGYDWGLSYNNSRCIYWYIMESQIRKLLSMDETI